MGCSLTVMGGDLSPDDQYWQFCDGRDLNGDRAYVWNALAGPCVVWDRDGRAMGVGTSLVMENVSATRRGILSGLLQEGYAAGNVLAAASYFLLYGKLGWRPLFFLESVPAVLLVSLIRFRVRESEVWNRNRNRSWREQCRDVVSHWKIFLYLLALMTMMLFASHGTQDMYPTFLQRQWHFTPMRRAVKITALSGLGAIVGGITVGHLSDRWGRRRAIVLAFVLAVAVIPVWAFAPNQRTDNRCHLDAVYGSRGMGGDSSASGGVVARFALPFSPDSPIRPPE